MMGDAKSSRRTVFQLYKILLIIVANIDHDLSIGQVQRLHNCCTPKLLPLSGFTPIKKTPCAEWATARELENRFNSILE